MNYKDLKLIVSFKLDWNSKQQSASMSVYNGMKRLSTVVKEFEIDPPPQEIKEYIDFHCVNEHEVQDTWCRYMRGEEYDPEPAEDYTDFLESRTGSLECELDEYHKVPGLGEDEEPWKHISFLYDDDELPF